MEFVEKYPEKQWNWAWISSNPRTTKEIIEKHMSANPYEYQAYWNWSYISCNPNITIEFIEKYSEKPWRWDRISGNDFKTKL